MFCEAKLNGPVSLNSFEQKVEIKLGSGANLTRIVLLLDVNVAT